VVERFQAAGHFRPSGALIHDHPRVAPLCSRTIVGIRTRPGGRYSRARRIVQFDASVQNKHSFQRSAQVRRKIPNITHLSTQCSFTFNCLEPNMWHHLDGGCESGRRIKVGGRPLVILQPRGPVMFVFDVSDTEPEENAPTYRGRSWSRLRSVAERLAINWIGRSKMRSATEWLSQNAKQAHKALARFRLFSRVVTLSSYSKNTRSQSQYWYRIGTRYS
jgi:hypothetical protein